MAKKKWIGPGKWNTGANWEGGTAPAVSTETEFVAAKNNACENNANAKSKSIEFEAGYTAAFTSTAIAVLKIGTTTGTGTALKLTSEVKWEPNEAMVIEFVSEAAETQKITTAGQNLGNVTFIGENGKWQLADTFKNAGTAKFELVRGTLETNGQTVELNGGIIVSGTQKRGLKLGASLVKLTGSNWDAGTTENLTFSAETSTIELAAGAAGFLGGGLTYNNLTITGKTLKKLEGANTFATLAVNNKEAAAKEGCKFESGKTQTLTGLTTNGAAGKLARIESTTEGSRHKLKKTEGTVELKYTVIKDSEAEGGATWIAGEGCEDGGNNVGWTFTGGATLVAGVAKIKLKTASATEAFYSAAGTTKAKFKTQNATTSSYSVQSAAKVRFATAGALSNLVAVAGATKVTFTDRLFVKVTKEGEEGRKVVFLIVDE